MKELFCIYHGNCTDGLASAAIVNRYAKLNDLTVQFHPGVYQNPPPDVTGKEVIIVDFSYKRDVMQGLIDSANSVTIFDHHKTAIEDLKGLNFTKAVFDTKRSGTGITWDELFPVKPGFPSDNPFNEDPRIPAVDYVEDYDLWNFKYPESKPFHRFIMTQDQTVENYEKIIFSNYLKIDEFVEEGQILEKFFLKSVNDILNLTKRRVNFCGYVVWAANVPPMYSSESGNILSQGEPFAITYYDTKDGRNFSLRSQKGGGVDVSEIAKSFGGGGHKNAAGFVNKTVVPLIL